MPRALTVNGLSRLYLLYIPARPDPLRPAPLILAFHGRGSSPEKMVAVTLLSERAGRAGFVVAYPAAHGGVWNPRAIRPPQSQADVDDVAFVRAILDDIASVVPIDQWRIFATGFSLGGSMAYHLACELSDRIAAVATVAGSLTAVRRKPERPVPVLHFHGTADRLVPYERGRGTRTQVQPDCLGVPETIAQWIEWNGCAEENRVISRYGKVTCVTHGGCRDGAEVTLYTIEGMGHQWPGETIRSSGRLAKLLGPGSEEISATDKIVEFFLAHPMPQHQAPRERA